MPKIEMTCPPCRVEMILQPKNIDLSRAVEVLRCPSCRCQAIRPPALDIRTARLAIA